MPLQRADRQASLEGVKKLWAEGDYQPLLRITHFGSPILNEYFPDLGLVLLQSPLIEIKQYDGRNEGFDKS